MRPNNTLSRLRRLIPIATMVAAGALLITPASGMAFRFGAKLDPAVQPSGAGLGMDCNVAPGLACTWVINDAYQRPNGGERSPFTGVLRKLRLIAESPGSFRLQVVKVKPNGGNYLGKAIRNGPRINYQGQPDPDEPYAIETFNLNNIRIKKGQRLAIKASNTSALRCSSGGDNTLLFQPPLGLGGGFNPFDGGEGCWLLIEAIARKS